MVGSYEAEAQGRSARDAARNNYLKENLNQPTILKIRMRDGGCLLDIPGASSGAVKALTKCMDSVFSCYYNTGYEPLSTKPPISLDAEQVSTLKAFGVEFPGDERSRVR